MGPDDPIGPHDPKVREIIAALLLANAAKRVSPKLQGAVLETALQQLSIASATIKKAIKNQNNQSLR
jgi:hypothetical protein